MRFPIAIAIFCLAATPAFADDDVPADAAQFAQFCAVAGNFDPCANRILGDAMIATIYAEPGQCTYPSDVSKEDFTANEHKVIDWVVNNPQPSGTKTDEAIQAAMNALWPC